MATPRLELEVEEETGLPVPIDVLIQATCRLLGEDGRHDLWQQFVINLQVIVANYYDTITNRVRQSYESPPVKAKESGLETRFLRDISQLMEAAQYSPLSQTQWDRADEGQFEFNFPVDVQWEKLDDDFTRRYFAEDWGGRYLGTKKRVPDFAQYVMLFTRGVSQTEKADLFIPDKINILIEAVWAKILSKGRKKVDAKPESARPENRIQRGVRKVRRTTLEDVCQQEGLLNVFLKKCVIREPVFKSVMVCYRTAPSRKERSLAKAVRKLRQSAGKEDGAVEGWDTVDYNSQVGVDERPMKIELYDNIPFGDLDSVLPCAQVNLRPLDTLIFLILVFIAGLLIFIAFTKIFFANHEGGVLPLIIMFVVVAIKELKDLINDWKMLRFKYTQKVMEYRQRRTVAAGMPVVTQLVDDVKNQELKEMLLGYFFLWRAQGGRRGPASLPLRTIDTMVEDFLQREFNYKADFEVEDAFLKLESLGLVAQDPGESGEHRSFRIAREPEQWLHEHPTQHLDSLRLRPEEAPASAARRD